MHMNPRSVRMNLLMIPFGRSFEDYQQALGSVIKRARQELLVASDGAAVNFDLLRMQYYKASHSFELSRVI